MHPSFLLPPPFLLFKTFLFLSILFPTYFATPESPDKRYTACTPFNCGNFTQISYPFWRDAELEHCGHPKFKLNCWENEAIINITSHKFRVLDINFTTQILKIARMDLLGNPCPKDYANFSLDFDFYEYTSNDENSSLLYECNHVVNSSLFPINFNFTCPTKGDAYFVRDTKRADLRRLGCSINMRVPVLTMAVNSFIKDSALDVGYVLDEGFEVRWAVDEAICQDCKHSGGKCGYNLTLAEFRCFCADQPYATTCANKLSPSSATVAGNHITVRNKVIIGITGGIVGALLIAIAICCLRTKASKLQRKYWKMTKNDQNIEAFIRNHGALALKRYKFSDVKKITNSFKVKLGQGGFGAVYKGELLTGCSVAVKILNGSKGNGEDFINEVASISRTSHVNIVTLLGFCIEGRKKALIYEFMPSGSLEKFIYNKDAEASPVLSWENLHHIAVGIARGLEYLHRGCNTRILHFDIKPHNILLDEDFCPKISDFGLAKLCPSRESIISMSNARGTLGYVAPEVWNRNFGGVSHKSDVYSYGMMLLEMVGGRKNINVEVSCTSEIYYPYWIHKNLEMGNSVVLRGVTTTEESGIAKKMILVGLWCVQTIPTDRPAISRVIEMLEGSINSLQMPPKPSMSSPPRSAAESSTA